MIVKTTARLNIRKKPKGKIVRIAEVGERLKVVSEKDGWYQLDDGLYCMAKFTEPVRRKKVTEAVVDPEPVTEENTDAAEAAEEEESGLE